MCRSSVRLPALVAAVVTAVVLVLSGPVATAPAHAGTWSIPASDPLVDPATDLDEFEVQLINQINVVRLAAGLKPIEAFDACVDRMAEAWARHLASTGSFEHRDQHQVLRRCRQHWAGENLVRGTLLTPSMTVDAWLASPSHREILLKKRARLAGIAVVRDSQGRYVGVLNVADPRGTAR
jgi:uncharacterized protein YkwD